MQAETERQQGAGSRRRKTRTGVVVSSAMDKTIVVAVERMVRHSQYGRVVRRTTKYYAHDEANACKRGDLVTIVESRPLSKLKRWRLREVVQKASGAALAPGSEADSEDRGRLTRKRRPGEKGVGAPAGPASDGREAES